MKLPKINITDDVLDEFPELVDYANHYLSSRTVMGGPVTRLNGSRCWQFTGFIGKDGYGIASLSSSKISKDFTFYCKAHRLAWMVWKGRIKYQINHLACNPTCINPDHLYDGTPKENSQDAFRRRVFVKPFNRTCKLTTNQVLMIRFLSRRNILPIEVIGTTFDVSVSWCKRIRDGKEYKYIPDGAWIIE